MCIRDRFRLNLLEDNLVLTEKDMGVEDGGILLSGYLDHAFPQRPDLIPFDIAAKIIPIIPKTTETNAE